jgi:DNA recombination protein RmuC
LVTVAARRPGDTGLLQQQLLDLRGRLDTLVTDVPRALADGNRDQLRLLADVRERLAHLGDATRQLQRVGDTVAEVQHLLQVPKLRGTLGEVWLEELLRQILPEAHYEMQFTFRSGERVDAVLRLGDRLVPVDAKFPLEACQRMLAAEGDAAERERRTFLRSVKERIDEVADKYIRPDEGTYEFALMYIPAENVYAEAVLRDAAGDGTKSVLTHALARRVIPVSPHTLYAYLLVIVQGLNGMRVAERAREILGDLGALRQQFDAFWGAFDKVGAHLVNAHKQFAESERHAGRVRERFERLTAGEVSPIGEERLGR